LSASLKKEKKNGKLVTHLEEEITRPIIVGLTDERIQKDLIAEHQHVNYGTGT
jgi:hypothetical protein